MDFSRFDWGGLAAQVEQARRAIDELAPNRDVVEQARLAAEQFDATGLAAHVEQARRVIDELAPNRDVVEQARLAAEQFDATGLAAHVEQARRVIDELAPSRDMVEQARLAAEQFDATGLAAHVEQARRVIDELAPSRDMVEQARLAAEQFDATGLAAHVEQARRVIDELAPSRDMVEQARLMASKLLADMPRLTPELFGEAWDERLAAAVGRLDNLEDILTDAPEPKRTLEELIEDAETVGKAAPPAARTRIWLVLGLIVELVVQLVVFPALADALREKVYPAIGAALAEPAPPDLPPAPDLPTIQELKPVTTALTLPGDWAVEGLPAIVQRAGPAAAERMVEFFTARIRNANTRAAYAKAVTGFLTWCDERGLELYQISPVAVGIYVEELQGVYRAPTIKQHLAAIRGLFDWLVLGQVVSWNPAATVRGPTHVVKRGKTPVLQPEEVRLLLDSIDASTVGGLRDRALLGVMIYSFARVSAVVNMNVDDYYQQGKRWWLRLREKGGKEHALPVHHKGEEYLDAYLETAGIAADRGTPLWRSLTRTRELGERRMSRVDVFRMVKRRVKAAELGAAANCHTFRASGITAYLLNGGTLERAQAIAGHESPRTTQLYDRTADDITVEDIERIRI